MSTTCLAHLRAVEADTRRLSLIDYPMPLSDFMRPLAVVQSLHPSIRRNFWAKVL